MPKKGGVVVYDGPGDLMLFVDNKKGKKSADPVEVPGEEIVGEIPGISASEVQKGSCKGPEGPNESDQVGR